MKTISNAIIVSFILYSQLVFSSDDNCASQKSGAARQICVLKKAKIRSEKKEKYWLIDFVKEDAFTVQSKKLLLNAQGKKEITKSDLCIATFFKTKDGMKAATAFCIAEFVTKTNGGYDKKTSCEFYSVDLGTGEIPRFIPMADKNGYPAKKCNQDIAINSIYRGAHNFLSYELFQNGANGTLASYVMVDRFGAVKKYLYKTKVNK